MHICKHTSIIYACTNSDTVHIYKHTHTHVYAHCETVKYAVYVNLMNFFGATDQHSATVQRGLCGLIDCKTV